MKKIPFFSLLMLLVATLASCNSNSFKIDGNLVNVDGGAVKVVFHGDSGMVDEWVLLDKKGRFTCEGTASQPVIVHVTNQRGETLAALVATSGDHIKLKGDASKAMGVKVRGNRLNEDWQLFRDEHSAFYTDPNPSRLDDAIEKFVREHPDNMLSTVLLVADYSDYSDTAKMGKLLKSIDAEARPESLLVAFMGNPLGRNSVNLPRLMTLTLIRHNDGFEEIDLTGHATLISLWANPQKDRNALKSKLQGLDKSIHIIDVLAEGDTLRWHKTIADDPEAWEHYWAPGGPLEQGIQLLGISSMPWFAVTDSTGLVTYSGTDLTQALRNLNHND